ncbi:uncharacterized protein [Procambarus clarkii]|uniref:uncharacterized protein n=1 Tax=Procambarus clarkii TaxID=6728 RepID=UPI001E67010A|nr:uncharacterized protein LOC123758086 [Procambarus clarkii]
MNGRSESINTTTMNGHSSTGHHCSLAALVNAAHMSDQPHQKQEDLGDDSTLIEKNGKKIILEDEMKRLRIDQGTEQMMSHQSAAQTTLEKERDRLTRRKWKCPISMQKYGPRSPYFHGSDPLYTANTSGKYSSESPYYHGSEPLCTDHINFSCRPQHDSDDVSCIVLPENTSNFNYSPQQDLSNNSWDDLSESSDSRFSVNPPGCELHRLRTQVVRSRSPVHVDDSSDGTEADLVREQLEVLMVMGFKSFFSNKSWWDGSTLS